MRTDYLKIARTVGLSSWGYGLAAIVSLISVRVYTELFPIGVFGAISLFLGACALVESILVMPLTQAIIRAYYDCSKAEGRALAGSLAKLAAVLAAPYLLMLSAILVGGLALSALSIDLTVTGLLLVAIVLIEVFKSSLIATLHAERSVHSISLFAFVDALILLLSVFAMCGLFPHSLQTFAIASFVSRLVALVVLHFLVKAPLFLFIEPPAHFREKAAEAFDFAKPISAMGPLGWIGSYLDRYVLGYFFSVSQSGILSASASIANRPFVLISTTLTNFFRARLFAANSGSAPNAVNQELRSWISLAVVSGGGLVLAISLLAPVITGVILASSYRESASQILPFLCFAQMLLIIQHAVDNAIIVTGHARSLLKFQVFAALLSVPLLALLISVLGLLGAAIARVVIEAIKLGALGILYRHLDPLRRPNSNSLSRS